MDVAFEINYTSGEFAICDIRGVLRLPRESYNKPYPVVVDRNGFGASRPIQNPLWAMSHNSISPPTKLLYIFRWSTTVCLPIHKQCIDAGDPYIFIELEASSSSTVRIILGGS